MEISIHRNGNNVWNYNSKTLKKNVKTLVVAPLTLLAMPTREEVQRMLNDAEKLTNETYKMLDDFGIPRGANTKWLENNLPTTPQIPVDSSDLKTIADFCRTIKEFIEGVIWCVANPFNALYNLMVWLEPMLLIICLVIASAGVLVYMLKMDKFLGKTPSQLTKNPILFYLLFKIILYSLSLVI